jgi:hypothetical protein
VIATTGGFEWWSEPYWPLMSRNPPEANKINAAQGHVAEANAQTR